MPDSDIRFSCPRCNRPLKVRAESAGQKIHCRGCGRTVTAPHSPAPAPRGPITLKDALLDAEDCLHALGETEQARELAELRAGQDSSELRVVIFGEFNRGKSTLINALLGRQVLSAKLVPTTGHVVHIVGAARDEVHVRLTSGSRETHDLDRLESLSSLDQDGTAREGIESIEVAVRSSFLRDGLVLVDTPGVNEKDAQTRRAVRAIASADLVLFVLDARQLLTGTDRSLAVDWLVNELHKCVVPVVNFMNFLDEADRADVRDRLDQWCKDNLRGRLSKNHWFEANALAALRRAVRKESTPLDDDFDSLRSALTDCSGVKRRVLQRASRRGQLLWQTRQIRQQNAEVLARIRTNAAKEEEERAVKRGELKDRLRRFDANAGSETDRIRNLVQKTLEGKLEELVKRFADQSKEMLTANSAHWYEDALGEAIHAIEKEANDALLVLTGDDMRRPGAMTLRERMILRARVQLAKQPDSEKTDVAMGVGAGVGAAIGTLILPVIGTGIGAGVGAWLGNAWSKHEGDPVAAFSKRAKDFWASDARDVERITMRQFSARLDDLEAQLTRRLRLLTPPKKVESSRRPTRAGESGEDWQLDEATGVFVVRERKVSGPLADELDQRERLDNALSECEQRLLAADGGRENGNSAE
jgi:Dynamin family/Glycine zipper